MKQENRNALLQKLNLDYPCVAIQFCLEKPDAPHYEGEELAFCQYVKHAQTTGQDFYITAEDDACYGKVSLGMIDKPPVTASGQAGYDFGCYKTPAGCRQLYQNMPVMVPGTVRYVRFCPAIQCDFDPDLLFFIADFPQADILMRATSYSTGDFWESCSTPVMSCAWMYAYPVISGKVNHITTGFYHGLRRRKAYPAGLRMIAVPFQKFDSFFTGLEEMDWTLIAFREDEESKKELASRMAHWQEMAKETGSTVDLH